MTRWWTVALLGVVLLTAAEEKKEPSRLELSRDEKALLELINKERAGQKLPALQPNRILFEVARAHSANMARQGKMEHELDGKTPAKRVEAAGYDYQRVGENIAWSDGETLAQTVKRWMDSKPHRENILREGYTETGVGIVRDGKGEVYYTQVFAAPRQR
jgi:uncharacterized protein YkwD